MTELQQIEQLQRLLLVTWLSFVVVLFFFCILIQKYTERMHELQKFGAYALNRNNELMQRLGRAVDVLASANLTPGAYQRGSLLATELDFELSRKKIIRMAMHMTILLKTLKKLKGVTALDELINPSFSRMAAELDQVCMILSRGRRRAFGLSDD